MGQLFFFFFNLILSHFLFWDYGEICYAQDPSKMVDIDGYQNLFSNFPTFSFLISAIVFQHSVLSSTFLLIKQNLQFAKRAGAYDALNLSSYYL